MNTYEIAARARKAYALVELLSRLGADSDAIRRMDECDWIRAAVLARVNPPSAATREMVAEILMTRGAS